MDGLAFAGTAEAGIAMAGAAPLLLPDAPPVSAGMEATGSAKAPILPKAAERGMGPRIWADCPANDLAFFGGFCMLSSGGGDADLAAGAGVRTSSATSATSAGGMPIMMPMVEAMSAVAPGMFRSRERPCW